MSTLLCLLVPAAIRSSWNAFISYSSTDFILLPRLRHDSILVQRTIVWTMPLSRNKFKQSMGCSITIPAGRIALSTDPPTPSSSELLFGSLHESRHLCSHKHKFLQYIHVLQKCQCQLSRLLLQMHFL